MKDSTGCPTNWKTRNNHLTLLFFLFRPSQHLLYSYVFKQTVLEAAFVSYLINAEALHGDTCHERCVALVFMDIAMFLLWGSCLSTIMQCRLKLLSFLSIFFLFIFESSGPVRSYSNLAHVLCYCAYIMTFSYMYCKQLFCASQTKYRTFNCVDTTWFNLEKEKPKTIMPFLWQALTWPQALLSGAIGMMYIKPAIHLIHCFLSVIKLPIHSCKLFVHGRTRCGSG